MIDPDAIPCTESGRVTARNDTAGLAPSRAAASGRLGSMPPSVEAIDRIMNGRKTWTMPATTVQKLRIKAMGSWMSPSRCSAWLMDALVAEQDGPAERPNDDADEERRQHGDEHRLSQPGPAMHQEPGHRIAAH